MTAPAIGSSGRRVGGAPAHDVRPFSRYQARTESARSPHRSDQSHRGPGRDRGRHRPRCRSPRMATRRPPAGRNLAENGPSERGSTTASKGFGLVFSNSRLKTWHGRGTGSGVAGAPGVIRVAYPMRVRRSRCEATCTTRTYRLGSGQVRSGSATTARPPVTVADFPSGNRTGAAGTRSDRLLTHTTRGRHQPDNGWRSFVQKEFFQ